MLKDIKLMEEEYQLLLKSYCDFGSESYIIRDHNKMIKLFKSNFGNHLLACEEEIEQVRENKFQKIIVIDQLGEKFQNGFRPLATYSCGGKFVGYSGDWFSYSTMQFACFSRGEVIYYLKMVKEKLELWHQQSIVYGDIKSDNILIDPIHKDIIFLDIDNIQIRDFPIDLMSSFVKNFVKNYGKVDEKLDSYMGNLLTLDMLYHGPFWYPEILEQLKVSFLPEELIKNNYYKNKKLAKEMVRVTPKYSGKYFIDSL